MRSGVRQHCLYSFEYLNCFFLGPAILVKYLKAVFSCSIGTKPFLLLIFLFSDSFNHITVLLKCTKQICLINQIVQITLSRKSLCISTPKRRQ